MILSVISTYRWYGIPPRNDKLIVNALMISRFRASYIKLHEIQSEKEIQRLLIKLYVVLLINTDSLISG